MSGVVSRRRAFGGLACMGLAGMALPAVASPSSDARRTAAQTHPDAELIALCERVAVIEREWAASVNVSGELPCSDPEYARLSAAEDRLVEAKEPLIERINALPIHTLEGYRARAQLIVLGDYGAVEAEDNHHGMVWTLITALLDPGMQTTASA